MAEHELKIWPQFFDAIEVGDKRFEWRKDDREPRFEVGDTLRLLEYYPASGHSGRSLSATVTYVLRGPDFGVPDGYAVLSIADVHAGGSPG